MSIETRENERRLSLRTIHVEGLESGHLDDLRFRPNKYFHAVDDFREEGDTFVVLYQKELQPVEGQLSIEQIRQALLGVIDAYQRVARDQTFYLYPDVEAFGLDRRQNLRIGLINARPKKDLEVSPQALCVDAFLRLIANHCPSGQKRIVSFNKPILTLRHLLQILERKPASPLWVGLGVLSFVAVMSYVLLLNFGPPRVRESLRDWTGKLTRTGKRMIRTGTQSWFDGVQKERMQREYRYPPMNLMLIIQPKTSDPKQLPQIESFLRKILQSELPKTTFQLVTPHPTLSPDAHKTWQELCSTAFRGRCRSGSWILQISKYKGGFRPLYDAIQEALKKGQLGLKLDVRFLASTAMMQVEVKEGKPPAAPSPRESIAPTSRDRSAPPPSPVPSSARRASPSRAPAPRAPQPAPSLPRP